MDCSTGKNHGRGKFITQDYGASGIRYEVGSVYGCLLKLTDIRKARGKLYRLEDVLMIILLAKLCGEDRPSGIAEWAKNHQEVLVQLLLSWLLGSSVRVCIVKSTKPSTILYFAHSDLPFAEHLMMVPIFSIHHEPFNDGLRHSSARSLQHNIIQTIDPAVSFHTFTSELIQLAARV